LFLNNVCKGLLDRKVLAADSNYSLVEARRSLEPGALAERLAKVVSDYFAVVNKAASRDREWLDRFVYTNNGFNIMLRLLSELLLLHEGRYSRARAEEVLLAPLGRYFAESAARIDELRGQSSEAGRANVATQLIEVVHADHRQYGHVYLERRQRSRFLSPDAEVLREFESMMRGVIAEAMQAGLGPTWEEQLPRDIFERATVRMEANEKLWPWARNPAPELLQYLDFTDYYKIIGQKWDRCFANVFREKDIVLGKLRELDPMRKTIMHTRNSLEPLERQRLSIYYDDMKQLVDEWRAANGPAADAP
jgi:hypothetical protein